MNIIKDIEQYVNIKYTDRGRSKLDGFDCWGLVLELTNKIFDISLPDPEYEIKTVEDAINVFSANDMYKWVDKIEVSDIKYGDLVAIKQYGQPRMPYHMGVYIGDKTVIHALKCGVVIQKLSLIKNYIIGVYRIKHDNYTSKT
jgi:cell wall-associated NlpC family hydrolase